MTKLGIKYQIDFELLKNRIVNFQKDFTIISIVEIPC